MITVLHVENIALCNPAYSLSFENMGYGRTKTFGIHWQYLFGIHSCLITQASVLSNFQRGPPVKKQIVPLHVGFQPGSRTLH